MIKKLIYKIKTHESLRYQVLHNVIFFFLRFSLPVNNITRPFFKMLYLLHVFVRETVWQFIRILYIEPIFKSQCSQVGRLVMEDLPYINGFGDIKLGDNVKISGKPDIVFSNKLCSNPTLIIGDNTFIGNATCFTIAQRVEIGSNCFLASDVSITDNDGHPLDYMKRRNNLPPDSSKPVLIGNDVWIGRKAMIMKGVTIGDRSIVGAGAIVTKNVLPDTVVGGNPAQVIKKLINEI